MISFCSTPTSQTSMENNVLVDNETSHDLSLFQTTLADFDLVPSLYDGNYSIIYHDWPHFSAFDVFQFSGDSFNVRIRFNNSFSHSLPILMNVINNAVLRSLSPSGDDVSTTNASLLKVYSQQLPLLESGVSEFDVGAFFSPVMIGFVFTIIPAGLVIDIVYDREINGRNLLRLNGVGFNLYFSSFLLVMMLLYLFSYFSLLIIIQAFQVPALVVPPGFATLALLYLIYMPSALLFSGCCSYAFDKQETARQFYPSIVTTFGFICYTAIVILDLLQGTQTSRPLHMVFTALVPYYIPFGALYYVNKVYVSCDLLNACGDITMADYMTPEIVVMLVFCVVDAFVFYVLLKVVDVIKAGGHVRDVFGMKAAPPSYNRIEPDCPPSPAEDEDVKEERERILAKLNNSETDSPAMLYDVGKTYEKSGVSNPKSCLSKEKSSTRMTAVKS
ncbi:UNVERIFIED_CONTAM: hypothetical protein GTU68_066750, partial [Idotea baltica]|nr:hypothetical protein [Idotea baltica]